MRCVQDAVEPKPQHSPLPWHSSVTFLQLEEPLELLVEDWPLEEDEVVLVEFAQASAAAELQPADSMHSSCASVALAQIWAH